MILNEYVSSVNGISPVIEESVGTDGKINKHWYLKGIFLQAEVRNRNGRVYPREVIAEAVTSLKNRISSGESVTGELDHPNDLSINSKEISHVIEDINMDGNNGIGKIRILNTPVGLIVKDLLNEGIKLGVSSRGQGELDYNDVVTTYEITTIDIVNQPSAPAAYPTPIYESLFNSKTGRNTLAISTAISEGDKSAMNYIIESLKQYINEELD